MSTRGVSRPLDDGAGAPLVIGIVAGVVIVTVTALPLLSAHADRRALAGVADAAALAAADTASGALAGVPCEAAQSVAELGGAVLSRCEIDGAIATIGVSRQLLGVTVEVRARAGPPSSPGARHSVGGGPED